MPTTTRRLASDAIDNRIGLPPPRTMPALRSRPGLRSAAADGDPISIVTGRGHAREGAWLTCSRWRPPRHPNEARRTPGSASATAMVGSKAARRIWRRRPCTSSRRSQATTLSANVIRLCSNVTIPWLSMVERNSCIAEIACHGTISRLPAAGRGRHFPSLLGIVILSALSVGP
jgi:hypothetical protein